MIKTSIVEHDHEAELLDLFLVYHDTTNKILEDLSCSPSTFYHRVLRLLLQSIKRQKKNCVMTKRGGYLQTGAEQKATNKPARLLHEAMKPQIYIQYWKQTDVYLPMFM